MRKAKITDETRTNLNESVKLEKKELIKLSSRFLGIVIAITAAAVAITTVSGESTIISKLYHYLINANLAWVTLILLAYAWRWEFTGGIAFLVAAFVYTVILYTTNTLSVILFITIPLGVTGLLFLADGIIQMVKREEFHTDDMNPLVHH